MRVLKRAPRCGCERTMVTCPSLGPGPFPRVRVPLCSQLFPGTQLPGSLPTPLAHSLRGRHLARPLSTVLNPGRPCLGLALRTGPSWVSKGMSSRDVFEPLQMLTLLSVKWGKYSFLMRLWCRFNHVEKLLA